MEETHKYICKYCGVEFVPKRRRVQKYCSISCKNGHYNLKKKLKVEPTKKPLIIPPINPQPEKTKINEMSSAGILNSVVGNLVANGIKALLTKKQDKTLTKDDMLNILSNIERLQEIKNLPPNRYGGIPHFDLETKTVVYIGGNKEQTNWDNLIV